MLSFMGAAKLIGKQISITRSATQLKSVYSPLDEFENKPTLEKKVKSIPL